MKRRIFTIVSLFLAVTLNATQIQLHQLTVSDKAHAGEIRHSPLRPKRIPIVNVDNGLLNIVVPWTGENCSLRLLSSDGTTLYNKDFVSSNNISFFVPEDIISQAATLVFKANGITYIGDFKTNIIST